jgi:hypothetical protein
VTVPPVRLVVPFDESDHERELREVGGALGLEGAPADRLVEPVAGLEEGDEVAGVGQGQIARLGELAAGVSEADECLCSGQQQGSTSGGAGFVLGGDRDGDEWQVDPVGRPRVSQRNAAGRSLLRSRMVVSIHGHSLAQAAIQTGPDGSGPVRVTSMAEGKGFEPLESRNPQRLSRPSHSSALATFRPRR